MAPISANADDDDDDDDDDVTKPTYDGEHSTYIELTVAL